MGCVALTSLMATMKLEFEQSIPRVSLDDEACVSMKSLLEKLSSLQGFVQEESVAGGGAAALIRELEMKIRDFALDAEDHIEIALSNFLLANNGKDQQKASQQLRQSFTECLVKYEELRVEIDDLFSKTQLDFWVLNTRNEGPLIPWLKHGAAASESSLRHSPMLVGRRRDHTLIMDKLIMGFNELEVISIVGMTGIGKTTLAASVYRDPSVASHFDVRRWVTMSGEYNQSQMLHNLLCTIVEADEIKKGSIPNDDLADEQVSKFLTGKRYLIVLDNIRNNQAWYDIRRCFPDDKNRSRIVLTTTHFSWKYGYSYTHNMTLLSPEESWDLFCNKFFLEQNMAPKFEKIRSQVVEKCEGLPHTIVVVRERLSKCDNIHQEWKKVAKELELLVVLDSKALTLTFNQLPQHLKVCFLYFGVFPKRSAIKVKLLIRLWIVEGFIKPLEYEELENQAYEYLQEFIDRSLILIDNWTCDGKIKHCRMHSALHSFCVREAQKEGIFCAVNTQQYPKGSFNMFANSCRWLSLYKHSFDYYVLFRTNTPRSIFFFQQDVGISIPFKLLRVLAFAPSSFLQRVVPTHLHELVFLRYLSVKGWFEGLDYIVSTNRNLQVLVVCNKESQLGAPTLHLPCTIWNSPQLQHLELDNSYVIDPPRVVKANMQTLSWVFPAHCRTGVYRRFPNIKKLKMFVVCRKPIILDNLDYLKQLERLTISVSFSCVVILPKPSMFPLQLKKLILNGTWLSEKDLMVIGILPQLEVLKLENAFHGEIWEVTKGGFYKLRFLLLEAKMLEQWMANDCYSFQHLEHLVLRFCYNLEEIPLAMSNSFLLKLIELEQCRPSVIASAKRIKHRCGNKNFEIIIKGHIDHNQGT